MNKKSNIIIGIVAVALVGVAILGMSVFSKGGKGTSAGITPTPSPVSVKESSSGVAHSIVKETEASSTSTGEGSGSFVASKQGKKYFPTSCGSAKTIKEENRVYFGSETEAEQAGYERTQTCK